MKGPLDGSTRPPSDPRFRRIPTSEDWFEVSRIKSDLVAFRKARHYEETLISLRVGEQKAVLIDTGCGIGDLRKAVEQITDLPAMVINTHTHADHVGSNRQFDEIALFDHPVSRQLARDGISHEILRTEILAENLVYGPWPRGFEPSELELPPFPVARWLKDGDQIDLGRSALEVIHTPGEAPDHICLLDRAERVLFCGDILLHGAVWTHLEGASLKDLIASYSKLMGFFDAFDYLMPSHNEPWIDKDLLPESLAGAEKIAAGEVEPEAFVDPWNRRLHRYVWGRFELLAAPS